MNLQFYKNIYEKLKTGNEILTSCQICVYYCIKKISILPQTFDPLKKKKSLKRKKERKKLL